MDTAHIHALVKKVQIGDETAFAELYDEFASRIYAFIRMKVFGSNEAEDILQEVFIKAWNGTKKLKLDDLNYSAWLYRVASNTINDHYRKHYRSAPVVPLEEAKETIAKETATASIHLEFDKKLIQENLEKLPSHFKQVIELRFFQEFSINETAEILNKNNVTIRVWQYRAIKRLEKLFQTYERLT